MKIAGVIVLYNPDKDVIHNISTYIDSIDILYAVDNSINKNSKLIGKLKNNTKIKYIDNKGNKGIAYALNVAAKMAISQGYEWLLTMDQDSSAQYNMMKQMKDYINKYKHNNIGIISPYQLEKNERKSKMNSEVTNKEFVMTSGNMLNLNAYSIVGEFENKLFIDWVDVDYCLRLNLSKYRVLMLNKALLYHNFGDIKYQHSVKTYNYNYIRIYYINRNALYLINKYKKSFPMLCKKIGDELLNDNLKVLLYEEDKLRKAISMIKAFSDYKFSNYGEFNGKY